MAWAHVSSTSAASTDAVNVTTPAIVTTGADTLFAFVSSNSSDTTPPTDNKTNTWIALTARVVAGGERGQWYYAKNAIVGSGHTFSVSASNLPSIAALAFSGGHLTAPFDLESGADTFGTTLQPGSITPTQNDEVVLQGVAFNTSVTYTINESYSTPLQHARAANNMGLAAAYKIQTTAAATDPTWTASAATSMAAVSASFTVAGPPPPSGAIVCNLQLV